MRSVSKDRTASSNAGSGRSWKLSFGLPGISTPRISRQVHPSALAAWIWPCRVLAASSPIPVKIIAMLQSSLERGGKVFVRDFDNVFLQSGSSNQRVQLPLIRRAVQGQRHDLFNERRIEDGVGQFD